MNLLMCLLSLAILALPVLASEQQKVIAYSGQDRAEVKLFSSKYHTEYRYERVWRTCLRQVPDGYETYCNKSLGDSQDKRRICERVNDRTVCHDDGGGDNGGGSDSNVSCYSRQTYRTEYYDCEEVVAHPYSVFDYNTAAIANVYFTPWPDPAQTPKAQFTLSLSDEGQLSASAHAADMLIYGNWSDLARSGGGTDYSVAANLSINFRPAAKIFKVLQQKISDLKIADSQISFTVPKGQDIRDYQISLKLIRVRWFILKDVVLLNRALSDQEFNVTEKGDEWLITIDTQLHEKLQQGKKYKVELAVALTPALYHNLLNASDIPKSMAQAKINKKIK